MKNQLISAAIINLIILQATSASAGSYLSTKDILCSAPHNTDLDINEVMGLNVPKSVRSCLSITCYHGKVVTSVKSGWCQNNLPTIANQKSMGDVYEVEAQESLATTEPSLTSTEDRITATRMSTTTEQSSTTLELTSTINSATRSTRYPLRFTINPHPVYKSTTEEPYDYPASDGESEGESIEGDHEDEINEVKNETDFTDDHIDGTIEDETDRTEAESTVSTTITPSKTKPTTTASTSTTIRQTTPETTTFKPITTEFTTFKPSITTEPSTVGESTSPSIVTKQFTKSLPRAVKTTKKTTKKFKLRKTPKINQEETNLFATVAEVRDPEGSSSLLLKHIPISIPDMFILILLGLAFFIVFFVAACFTYCIKKVFFKKEKVQVVVEGQRHRMNLSNYNFDV